MFLLQHVRSQEAGLQQEKLTHTHRRVQQKHVWGRHKKFVISFLKSERQLKLRDQDPPILGQDPPTKDQDPPTRDQQLLNIIKLNPPAGITLQVHRFSAASHSTVMTPPAGQQRDIKRKNPPCRSCYDTWVSALSNFSQWFPAQVNLYGSSFFKFLILFQLWLVWLYY